jgi:predicted ABC-type ATPase
MIIVAGPPGGGKSRHFPVKNVGVDWFNSDDRAAQLNAGSYQNIPVHVRSASGQQLQQFIDSHIEARRSFAFENALRTDTGFQQIRRAKEMGFRVLMDYVAAGPVEEHVRRVTNRAALGGHSASERKLREIFEHSMKNLLTAFEENRHQRIDLLRIFDNSENFGRPRLVLSMVRGVPRNIAAEVPAWLETALAPSNFNIGNLRGAMKSRAWAAEDR